MPAIQQVVPRRGREFWHSLDPDDSKHRSALSRVGVAVRQVVEGVDKSAGTSTMLAVSSGSGIVDSEVLQTVRNEY